MPQKTLILIRADKCLGLTPRESCDILQGTDYSRLSPLLAMECNCRCKTALVINTPLSSWVLRQIDQAGFGAHCIQGVATSLGLLLLGRAQLADKDLWALTTHPTTLKQINPKAAEKFIHRLRLFRQPVLSVVSKSIAFNTFGGFAHELYEEHPPAINRQTHEVRVLWQAWARIVGEVELTRALSSRGSIKQRVHAVKKCSLKFPAVHSSSGAILAMHPTKTSQATHLTDQLTRK